MFGKKKTLNLKSSYLRYFKEKNSLKLTCKSKHGFSTALCKKQYFLISMKKNFSETLIKYSFLKICFIGPRFRRFWGLDF